ncbi:MAG: RHS repeat-associated core domain-containing protein [Bacteroidales bacterium]|nr:RHS repeat-associated core domain-containing protein [Bacteroidales bacterium]
MKKRSISILASCIIIAGCLSQTLCAQQNGFQHFELQVLSPTAHEMGKYGKIPVSYFNGLPNISVPLTEVRAKGYSLPVYLTYYAGGNRPDQHPGWVGQGWSLHAGGSITRIIHGRKDDLSKDEYSSTLGSGGVVPAFDPGYLFHLSETQNEINWNNDDTLYHYSYYGGYYTMDHEPDEFLLNIEGLQATFYITGDNEVQIVSKGDASFDVSWTIETDTESTGLVMYTHPSNQNNKRRARRYTYLKSFVIRDREGNAYYFGGDDNSIEYSIVQHSTIYPTGGATYQNTSVWNAIATANTWMLTKIERPDGEVISFTYKQDGIPIVVHDFHHGFVYTGTFGMTTLGACGYDTYYDPYAKNNLSITFLRPLYLESISCRLSGDSLTFNSSQSQELNYSIDEQDFQLRVGYYQGSTFSFSFNDFMDRSYYLKLDNISGTDRNISFSYTNNTNTRLKLNSVKFLTGVNGTTDNKYEFRYNSTTLPEYNSRKTDRWGYFNGTDYYNYIQTDQLYSIRNPNVNLMKAEILEEIVYPTGGRTTFEYEPHSYYRTAKQLPFSITTNPADSIAGGLRIKTITDNPFRGTSETRSFSYVGSYSGATHSSGILSGRQQFKKNGSLVLFAGLPTVDTYNITYSMYSEEPLNMLSDTDGNHITYSRVIEDRGAGGSTIYKYSNHETTDATDSAPINVLADQNSDIYMLSAITSAELFRGLLLEKEDLNGSGQTVHKEVNNYSFSHTDVLKTITKRLDMGPVALASYNVIYCGFPYLYSKTVTEKPDSGNNLSDSYSYEYNSFRRSTNVTHTVGSATDGTVTYYPGDRSGIIYTRMADAGMAGVPVGIATLRQGKVIAAKEMTFRPESIDTESGYATTWLPDKLYSAELSSPVNLSTYNSSPSSYRSAVPDIDYRSYDSHGNITGIVNSDGISTIYEWGKDALNPIMVAKGARTPSVSFSDSLRIVNYEIDFGGSMSATYYFSTTAAHTVTATIYGSSYYDWLYLVQVDNQSTYIVSSQIPGTVPNSWVQYLMSYSGVAEFTVPAGDHTITIQEMDYRTGSGTPTHPYGTIQLRYYDAVTTHSGTSDVAVIYNFEDETGSTAGFNSAHGHSGTKTVNLSIPSDREYILDYMLKSGSTWTYNSMSYTGGNVTVGASGKVVDNIRIYPAYSNVTSYTWYPAGKMRSATDVRGVTETYEYDNLGRLTYVKNDEGNNVKSYVYYYADTTSQNNAKINHNSITEKTHTTTGGTTYRSAVRYMDGLGRPVAEILENGGGAGEDILTAQSYDSAGRLWKKWIPTPISGTITGTFSDAAQSAGQSFYSDTYPYNEATYETSPRERIISEYGAGADWRTATKDIEHGMMSNSSVSSNMLYHRGFKASLSSSGTLSISKKTASSAATLKVFKTTDEDSRVVLEFYNSYGEKVLERRLMTTSSTGWYDTHYVYDDMGRLVVVIPPKLTNTIGSSTSSWSESSISSLAYIYRYDSRGNCIAKSLPGGGWTYIVYDKYNRPVMTQDAVQRSSNQWTFGLVDNIGRPAVSGTATLTLDAFDDPYKAYDIHAELPKTPTYSGTFKGYTVTDITLLSPTLLSVNYYDWMKFLTVGGAGFPAANSSDVTSDSPGAGYASLHSNSRGLLTGNLTRVLDNTTGNQYLWFVYYYDKYGRVAQSRESTQTGGVTKNWMGYDFSGNRTLFKTTHIPSLGSSVTQTTTYSYDTMGRPTVTTHKIGSGSAVTIASLSYDGIGRLAETKRTGSGASSTLEAKLKSEYAYNLRSWLTEISGGLFSESLQYQDAASSTYRQWGGNISGMDWEAGDENRLRHYDFTYDKLSRLTAATYVEDAISGAFNATYSYDRNTNLSSIQHKGLNSAGTSSTTVLSLSPTLSGNQISSVATYDAKGRQTSATQGTSRTVTYNLLDLPQQETIGSDIIIDRKYGSDGVKYQEKVTTNNNSTITRDYVGNMIYENGSLKKIIFDGGYADMTGSSPAYRFFLTDHLGSVRVVAASDGTVMQVNHYYPYGGLITDNRHTIPSSNISDSRYRFIGKELSTESGEYDFGARFLDPIPGRFNTLDPLAEKYYNFSPYAYCAGNPMNLVDLDGKDWSRKWRHNSVTVSATIFADTKSMASAKQAASYWNNRKEDYYFIGDKSFRVLYDIIVVESPFLDNNQTDKNTYEVTDERMINANGEEDSGRTYVQTNSVKVNSKYSMVIPGTNRQSLTGAHELGHLLGIKGHIDNTLMSTSPDSNRTSSITQEQINAIVESEKGHNDFISSLFLWVNQLFK